MVTPRFSFLTTAYRTEALLPATIDSVVAQTSGGWELIVVDNGRSDAIAAVVDRYARSDPRIRLVRQDNRGYCGGIMAAAGVATGDYVCVLDSDDQLVPEFCARVAEVLDTDPAPDAVAVDAHRFVDEDVDLPVGYTRSIGVTGALAANDVLTYDDVLAGRIPYYTAAVRRSAWETVGGYDIGVAGIDDPCILFWARLAHGFTVRMLPDRLARYRLRIGSESRNPETIDAFERELMASYAEAAALAPSPARAAVVRRTVGDLRYLQSVRHAREALLRHDISGARAGARAAFAERHTVRAGALVAATTVAPGLLIRIRPAKQRMTASLERAAGRARRRIGSVR